jgi:quinol monooxygenase YgiN
VQSCISCAEIKPSHLESFREAIEIDAIGSRTEPGCLRFDVLEDKSNPCKFVFYEVYVNADAITFHKACTHFQAWTDFKVGFASCVFHSGSFVHAVACTRQREG